MSAKTKSQPKPQSNEEFPSAFELIGPSWEAVKLNLITLIEFIVVPVAVALLGSVLFMRKNNFLLSNTAGFGSSSNVHFSVGAITLFGISGLLWLLFAPGITYTILQSVKGKTVDFMDAFKIGLHYFWRFLGVSICTGLIILGGFLLLIVPGFFMIRRYILATYYLVDRDLGVFETLDVCGNESVRYSSAVWGLLGVELILGIVITVIKIIPVIGWLISIFLNLMFSAMPAVRYWQIKAVAKAKS